MESNNISRISIQVGLSGYSFKVYAGEETERSGWQSADRIFTTSQFQKMYDEVDVSVFTPKCTLVPTQFCPPESARQILSEVVELGSEDTVETVGLPQYGAVLVFSNSIGETLSRVIADTVRRTDGSSVRPLPEMYHMLMSLKELGDYNKIVASYMDGILYLVVAQGNTLLLCNSYKAVDFTTAEYFIFSAMKKFQLNPEVSSICFRTPLDYEQEMSLYRYFKSVDKL